MSGILFEICILSTYLLVCHQRCLPPEETRFYLCISVDYFHTRESSWSYVPTGQMLSCPLVLFAALSEAAETKCCTSVLDRKDSTLGGIE